MYEAVRASLTKTALSKELKQKALDLHRIKRHGRNVEQQYRWDYVDTHPFSPYTVKEVDGKKVYDTLNVAEKRLNRTKGNFSKRLDVKSMLYSELLHKNPELKLMSPEKVDKIVQRSLGNLRKEIPLGDYKLPEVVYNSPQSGIMKYIGKVDKSLKPGKSLSKTLPKSKWLHNASLGIPIAAATGLAGLGIYSLYNRDNK